MEVFLLEEEDSYGDIFVTQTPKVQSVDMDINKEEESSFLGLLADDFRSPCTSLLSLGSNTGAQYLDISDDEMPPSSQQTVEHANFE